MVSLGVFLDDADPSEHTYISNPTGGTAIIGSFDTTVVEGGEFATTLKMDISAVPEPSVAMLGGLMALFALRRKRGSI
jgi:hypothetical protein